MKTRIRCVALDDEPLALEIIQEYVEQEPGLELVCGTTNQEEALNLISQGGIDLLFLDIQMPGMSGLEFIKMVDGPCDIILTTAFPQYALEGFELDVVDYLLKPIPHDRFRRAVQKVKDKKRLEALSMSDSGSVPPRDGHFFVKTDYATQRIDYDEVHYIEGLKDYVAIHTDSGKIISLQVMKKMEEFLPSAYFIRVHRSFIVALDRIRKVERNRLFVAGREIPIGETYKHAFHERIAKLQKRWVNKK